MLIYLSINVTGSLLFGIIIIYTNLNFAMRLRTFESFWLVKNGILNSYPSLQENLETEIAVIGAGITGALTSYALMQKGYKVVLLDKRDIAMGSSSATTSMLQYEIDVPLFQLAEMIGEAGAVQCYKAGIKAIKDLAIVVAKENLDCGFENKNSLYLAHSKKAVEDLRKEFEIRQKHQLGVTWLDKNEVEKTYGLQSYGAILSDCGASVDAYKLAHELIKLNVKNGMKVYDQTMIEKFNLDTEKPTITIDNGNIVTCNKVIFCTGFEATEMIKEDIAKLFYTYACVSEKGIAMPKQLTNTLVWDTDDPYTYMRTTDDGRLLIGGEDSSYNIPFFQQKIKEHKAANLIKKLQRMIPDVKFIQDFNWGGTFGTTKDGLPYIGASPEFANSLFVLGFGGNGITFSVQAMDIITDMLDNKTHPLEDYYRFGR
jgi:glycine/D-amino acid oxidase-like deaminating enzyme